MKIKLLLKNFIKTAVAVILIIILFQKVDMEDLKKAAGMVRKEALCASLFISLFSVFLNAFKWKILLPGMAVSKLIKTCFKAQFYTMVLPGQLFGEASKVIDLKESREPQGKVASSVIIDKITGLIGTMAVGIAGLAFTGIQVPDALRAMFVIMLFLLLALIFAWRLQAVHHMAVCGCCYLWKSQKPGLKKSGRKLYRLYDIWESYADSGAALFQSILMGAAKQALGAFQVWLIAGSMGLGIGYAEFCWITPAVSVILLLPVSFGGLGVREISLSGFLALFGAGSEKAIVISVILMLSQIVEAVIGMVAAGYDWMKHFGQKKPETVKK